MHWTAFGDFFPVDRRLFKSKWEKKIVTPRRLPLCERETIFQILGVFLISSGRDFLVMEICNIVSSSTIPIPINIDYIHQKLGDKVSRKPDFSSVNIKLHTSDLCQIFANGKMIVIGGRTVFENSQLFREYIELLDR